MSRDNSALDLTGLTRYSVGLVHLAESKGYRVAWEASEGRTRVLALLEHSDQPAGRIVFARDSGKVLRGEMRDGPSSVKATGTNRVRELLERALPAWRPVKPSTVPPESGVQFPFSVSDIAHATARILGADWWAVPGSWGTSGTLYGPFIPPTLLDVWYEGLRLHFERDYRADYPEQPVLPDGAREDDYLGVLLDSTAADGLDAAAHLCASTIRALIGR